jgi:hypothetical protein
MCSAWAVYKRPDHCVFPFAYQLIADVLARSDPRLNRRPATRGWPVGCVPHGDAATGALLGDRRHTDDG